MFWQFLGVCALFVVTTTARADEPQRELLPMPRLKTDLLPPPTIIVEMGPFGPALPGYFLPDRYAHWQLYGIDRQGFYQPRVIRIPEPFYMRDGTPYRYMPTRPLDIGNFPGVR